MSRVSRAEAASVRRTKSPGKAPGDFVVLPVDEVKEDPANENLHPELQLVMLTASVRLYGQQRAIIIDRAKVCKAGNGILKSVRRAGLTHVRCKYTELSGALADGYRLGDNLVTRLRQMDAGITAANLSLIVGARPDITPDALGLDAESLARALDPSRWSGKVVSVDTIGDYEIDDETFIFKVAGVPDAEAEALLARVNKQLEGTGYEASLR